VRWWAYPRLAAITEMVEPWRRGRALIVPWFPTRALAIGLWFKMPEDDYSEDFKEEQWLSPHAVANVAPQDIGEWSAGPEEEATAQV
jgi:hypothetical protein